MGRLEARSATRIAGSLGHSSPDTTTPVTGGRSIDAGQQRRKWAGEVNLLSAFTLTIAGAIAAGLPMAVAIIWVCS